MTAPAQIVFAENEGFFFIMSEKQMQSGSRTARFRPGAGVETRRRQIEHAN
jgi:hypothetical protein